MISRARLDVIKLSELSPSEYPRLLQAMLDYLEVEIVREQTPEYTSYKLQKREA
jgi:hypothetical protein